jgi:hypothetical protein
MIYGPNRYSYGFVLISLTLILLSGILRYFTDQSWDVSSIEIAKDLAIFLSIYLFLIFTSLSKLELKEHSFVIFREIVFPRRVEYPYLRVKRIYRVFVVFNYFYGVEIEHQGKTVLLILNNFYKYKEILKAIVSKVDKSIVEKSVYKAVKL